jgi:hypothetical protein
MDQHNKPFVMLEELRSITSDSPNDHRDPKAINDFRQSWSIYFAPTIRIHKIMVAHSLPIIAGLRQMADCDLAQTSRIMGQLNQENGPFATGHND